ncbi:lipoprotein insertase outer membrane protein LolB [Porticoccaceae bacterium]|nr:lipoprotein insertase outer membrane protein LolB [Porticoccaceae bacterium]MDC1512591.1 lipoprotein insertase outer membrane protein LolB [Porticoccaceae bacterium]
MNRVLLLLAVFTLSACAMQSLQPPRTAAPSDWQTHQLRVSQLNDWRLAGKLGFRGPDNGGSASVNWQQQQNNFQLQLSGPFGAGRATLSGNQQIAEMLYQDKLYRQTPQQLASQLIGVPLPVGALSWWARGLPSPDQETASSIATSPEGYASSFEQAGWQLSFSRYSETDAGSLPSKIIGTHQSSDNRRYSFKLVISDWSFAK